MTTDDEAFIRAIVAAPGDDAPRLGYADWLDERDDPRGRFVRDEVRWAKNSDAFEWKRLNKVSEDLNAEWVARVGRPPVGVCCDDLPLVRSGPPLSPQQIADAETRLGISFPAAFRAFLLNSNGGQPARQRFFKDPSSEDYDFIEIERFFAIYPPGQGPFLRGSFEDLELVDATVRGIEGSSLDGYLAIATVEDEDYLLIGVAGEMVGRVYSLFTQPVSRLARIADSFPLFLLGLSGQAPDGRTTVRYDS